MEIRINKGKNLLALMLLSSFGVATMSEAKECNFNKRKRLAELSEEQRDVTQNEATETPFKNKYWDNKKEGIYVDIVSGEALFSSIDKYKSGTGWPSFTRPLEKKNIVERTDYKLVYPRTEVSSKCGKSHLGHVFKDGPKPTGLRYCINSASLRFIPKENLAKEGFSDYLKLFDKKTEKANKIEKVKKVEKAKKK